MADHRDEAAVRARAYQLWEESGYADGSQDAHWRQAEREVAARAQAGEADPSPEGIAPQHSPPTAPARHSDGMSMFRSVLDPAPAK